MDFARMQSKSVKEIVRKIKRGIAHLPSLNKFALCKLAHLVRNLYLTRTRSRRPKEDAASIRLFLIKSAIAQ